VTLQFKYTDEFGISAPALGWVPAPTYILRRSAVLDLTVTLPPGRLLEMGCGVGALLVDFATLGFSGIGIDISKDASGKALRVLKNTPQFNIHTSYETLQFESFDYLFSFEVLEHIEDDCEALIEWLKFLKPGGTVLLSVPAHRKKWNITDLMVGHYRRYDMSDVHRLLTSAKLISDRIYTYGWPFTPAIEKIRLFSQLVKTRKAGIDYHSIGVGCSELTKKSGIDRQSLIKLYPLYSSRFGRLLFKRAIRVQRKFYDTQLGISYLILAHKPMK